MTLNGGRKEEQGEIGCEQRKRDVEREGDYFLEKTVSSEFKNGSQSKQREVESGGLKRDSKNSCIIHQIQMLLIPSHLFST